MSGRTEGEKCSNRSFEENNSECLTLMKQRKELYENHLREFEALGSDGNEVKMDVMYSMF
jgi:hypothetical protein